MLDLCPRFITRLVPIADKRYLTYVFTALGVAIVSFIYLHGGWQEITFIATGYDLVGSIRTITHYGLNCPVCGGTRSFIYMFSGNLLLAIHHNIFGVILFLITYLLLPFRVLIVCGINNRFTTKVQILDAWFENKILYLIFISYAFQLGLDYSGILKWLA